MDDLFRPPTGDWQRVSPKLATIRRLLILIPTGALLLVGVVLGFVLPWWVGALLVVIAIGTYGWGWLWAGRNQRSWGYAENADDLLVTRGVMFRRLVAIPYGRMQFVDVQAGPLARTYGVATVTLHTASTETAADIPGLPAAEATRLRNRLTELGEAHGAGV